MNDSVKDPVASPGSTTNDDATTPPRVATRMRKPSTTATPTKQSAKPATASRARRQPNEVEQTVAKHQRMLADALAKAQAINYDQPKVIKPEADKPTKAVKPIKEKATKAKKPKLVRDSFAMPEPEYGRIGELKQRLAALGAPAKKSEVLRGGIAALAALNDSELKAVMGRVERIKTGRPNK